MSVSNISLRLFLMCSVVLSYCGHQAPTAVADAEGDSAADSSAMVIMAPAGPILAELRISVDSQAYRLWVTNFLSSRLDADRDGRLTLKELELIPQRLLQQTTIRSAKACLRAASDSASAEHVSVDRFTEWLAAELSRSFDVIAGAVQAAEAVRLAGLIDQSGDGRISREELSAGSHALRFRDLDDDQTFSAAELLPYRDPRNQQAAVIPDVADLPFVQLGDSESIRRTAEQILKRYGDDGLVSVSKFRLPDSVVESVDASGDQKLNAQECRALLQSPDFHLVLSILLADRSNASDLKFEIAEHAAAFCSAAAVPGRRGRARLILDDMPVEVRARGGGVQTRRFLTGMLLQRMSIYDADRSGYLAEDEFPAMQQQMAQENMSAEFADADLNGDGMLFRDELMMFIERDAVATQSRIEVSVRQDGKTLFKLIDTNRDRRLSRRELLEGFDILLEYDADHDQQLTEAELGTAYALEIGLGQASSLRMDSMMQGMNMAAQSTDAILPGLSGLNGPEWFRRMDRNQDRDVSLREFLGPHRIFRQLDTDNNQLLSAAEAEELESLKKP